MAPDGSSGLSISGKDMKGGVVLEMKPDGTSGLIFFDKDVRKARGVFFLKPDGSSGLYGLDKHGKLLFSFGFPVLLQGGDPY